MMKQIAAALTALALTGMAGSAFAEGDAAAGENRDAISAAISALDEAAQPFAQRRMDRAFATALTGKRFGYDLDRWRAWWRDARP